MVQLETSNNQFPTPLTIDEFIKKYQLKKSWVYSKTRLKGAEQLPHLRMGKYIRIFESEALLWMRDKQVDRNL